MPYAVNLAETVEAQGYTVWCGPIVGTFTMLGPSETFY